MVDVYALETEQHTYSRGADLLTGVAKGFDIVVSDEQNQHWQNMFHAMHELDAILDSDEPFDARSAKYDEALGLISGQAHEGCIGCYACNLKAFTASASGLVLEKFVLNADRIKYLGEERRAANKASTLGAVAIEEGKLSAELLELDSSTKASLRFNSWLGNVGIVGALFDTTIDLPSDYDTGLTQVRPTLKNRLVLASMSTPYATRVVRHIKPSMIPAFAKALSAVSDDQTKDLIRLAA